MRFELVFTPTASGEMDELENTPSKAGILKAVRKTLGLMETNLRHPGLNTHKFTSLSNSETGEVFVAYAQQNTPAAYRVFWRYGPLKKQITIIAVTPHP